MTVDRERSKMKTYEVVYKPQKPNSQKFPKYEVWGGWFEDARYGASPDFLEDCETLEEAREAVKNYRSDRARYAEIRDKETQEIVD